MDITVLRFDSIDSTNLEAIRHARRGAAEGVCIVADEQTAGRGRRGRQWSSEKGSGLYFSIILRPEIEKRFMPLITLMTAVAVCDSLAAVAEIEPDIKWPNDVHVDNRKICGILAETTESDKGLSVIVGIGINLTSGNFSDELANIATSIEEESGTRIGIAEMVDSLTGYLKYFYDILGGPGGPGEIRNQWSRRSSYSEGKSVRVNLGARSVEGVTNGLDETGSLRLKLSDGSEELVQAGDVEQLRENS